jgi:hypothetical protein
VLDQPIEKLCAFVPKVGIELEQPVGIGVQKPANSFKTVLSKFKLKITSDLLSGQWD